MEHPGINGCCHQVIGSCDGMNVTSQMEVKLNGKEEEIGRGRTNKKSRRRERIRHKKSRHSNVVVDTLWV